MREQILFDDNWLFHKGDIVVSEPKSKGPVYTSAKTESMKWGPASIKYLDSFDNYSRDVSYNGEKWVKVDLPHDYVVSGEMYEDENPALGFFKYENAWYRKHFTVDTVDEGKRITLLFEGIATRSTVYLNGCELKHNNCGYSTFEVDITDYIQYGKDNVLAVYVRYHQNEGWWYQGGGIYRHVWLIKTRSVAVDLYGVFIRANKKDNAWQVLVDTEIRNELFRAVNAKAVTTLIDKQGNEVLCTYGNVCINLRDKAVAKYTGEITDPHIWDIDDPYLYTVKTDIYVNDALFDTVYDRFGFRDFEFTADRGLILNGRRVFIYGVCGHGDFGLTGKAVPDNILRHKARMLKDMGANGYRVTHYPQTAAFMDALDELGFIVMDETRWFHSTEEGIEQLKMLVKRDRNRPSVFMWSLGNEEPHHLTETGRRINKAMMAEVKKLDPTRPTTAAVSDSPDKATVYEDMELVGINYNHYLYDAVREKYPNKPIYASECCATSTTRGWYEDINELRQYHPAYDHDTTKWFIGRETFMQVIKERPWVVGIFQWIAFEHRGEAVWPRICSQAGAIDLFLQKKDAFYQNKSIFTTEPMIHLLPHWNFTHKKGESISVWAYTNCQQAELFLNGVSLGIKDAPQYKHVEWSVPFEEGTISVVGYIDGKKVCRDGHTTSGKPQKLMLKCENAFDVSASGQDIALFTCYCVDENGIEVPDASPYVSFDTNALGTIVGTGSDISDHIPVTCPDRKMRAGRISVAVKVKGAGELKVYANAENLHTGYIKVDIK